MFPSNDTWKKSSLVTEGAGSERVKEMSYSAPGVVVTVWESVSNPAPVVPSSAMLGDPAIPGETVEKLSPPAVQLVKSPVEKSPLETRFWADAWVVNPSAAMPRITAAQRVLFIWLKELVGIFKKAKTAI